jgi:hypothetical protein
MSKKRPAKSRTIAGGVGPPLTKPMGLSELLSGGPLVPSATVAGGGDQPTFDLLRLRAPHTPGEEQGGPGVPVGERRTE